MGASMKHESMCGIVHEAFFYFTYRLSRHVLSLARCFLYLTWSNPKPQKTFTFSGQAALLILE